MKKDYLILLGLMTLIVMVIALRASISHAQEMSFPHNLYYGIQNSTEVKALQEFLTDDGDYAGPISGNFFSLTKSAVKKFQSKNGLPVTGYFGVLSRSIAEKQSTDDTPIPSVEVGTTTDQYIPKYAAPQIPAQAPNPVQTTPQITTPTQIDKPIMKPEFVTGPEAKAIDLQDGTKKVTISFTANQEVTGQLGLMQQGTRGNWDSYVVQETEKGTVIVFQIIRPINAVEFYGVAIEAGGQMNYSYGQVPQISN